MFAKKRVKTLEIENTFLKNDVGSKQNLKDYLLENYLNLLNHQYCRVIQDDQCKVQSGINTGIIDIDSNNHGINTITNEKTINQTTYYKNNDETTTHRDNNDSNLIKLQSG